MLNAIEPVETEHYINVNIIIIIIIFMLSLTLTETIPLTDPNIY